MAEGSELAQVFRSVGITAREAGRGAARGVYRFNMAWHSSLEVTIEPGLDMLLCRGCCPSSRTPWPCQHYERMEHDLADAEARWAREDRERVAS